MGSMAASMSMMLMRQLEAMKSSIDRGEQGERKQERRERKKWKIHKKTMCYEKGEEESKNSYVCRPQ